MLFRIPLRTSMVIWPLIAAHIAKLITTTTSHMIASSLFFHNKFTFLTTFISIVIIKTIYTAFVTLSWMFRKKTLRTVLDTTDNTRSRFFFINNKVSLTSLVRAKSSIAMSNYFLENKNSIVSLTLLHSQFLKNLSIFRKYLIARLLQAFDLFEIIYLFNHIVDHTIYTKTMIALWTENDHICCTYHSETNGTLLTFCSFSSIIFYILDSFV